MDYLGKFVSAMTNKMQEKAIRKLLEGLSVQQKLVIREYDKMYKDLHTLKVKKRMGFFGLRWLNKFHSKLHAIKIKDRNEYTNELIILLPVFLEHAKTGLHDSDIQFIDEKLFPYIKSCEEHELGSSREKILSFLGVGQNV